MTGAASGLTWSDAVFRVPYPARIHSYVVHDKNSLAVDRSVGDYLIQTVPLITPVFKAAREFEVRAARLMAARELDQFVQIGPGFEHGKSLHEVLPSVCDNPRLVYIDSDPLVVRHLLTYAADGWERTIQADLRAPNEIVSAIGDFIDWGRPVALVLTGVLHYVPGEIAALQQIVRTLAAPLAGGSMVAISHASTDGTPVETQAELCKAYKETYAPLVLRSRDEIASLFGFPLVEPGLCHVADWQPEQPHLSRGIGYFGGLARVERLPD